MLCDEVTNIQVPQRAIRRGFKKKKKLLNRVEIKAEQHGEFDELDRLTGALCWYV